MAPTVTELANWAAEQKLLPVVGFECLRIGVQPSPDADASDPLFGRILRRLRRCAHEDPGVISPESLHGFVDHLALSRLGVADFTASLGPRSSDEASGSWDDAPDYEDQLHEFTIHLIEASVVAGQTFARNLCDIGATVSLQDHTVRLGDEREQLWQSLDQAIDPALGLKERAEKARHELLKHKRSSSPATWDDSRVLWETFGAQEVSEQVQTLHKEVGIDRAASARIDGASTEFLANLVWHCLRFDSALPPTQDDLAFQLSLVCGAPRFSAGPEAGYIRIRRPARAHIDSEKVVFAEAELSDSLAHILRAREQIIEAISAPSQNPFAERDRFYDALACSLLGAMDQRSGHKRKRNPSLVFTTNFGLEMEQAIARNLRRQHEKFHVLIPVVIDRDPDSEDVDMASTRTDTWLLGTFNKDDELDPSVAEWEWALSGDNSENADTRLPDNIGGPVVVKLCGSPLHGYDIGEPAPRSLNKSRIKDHGELLTGLKSMAEGSMLSNLGLTDDGIMHHATVVSEFEHFRTVPQHAFLDSRSLPGWVPDLVNRKRDHLVFLGPSIDDWLDRLWVFVQVQMVYGDASLRSRRRMDQRRLIAVRDEFDPLDSLIMESLGIEQMEAQYSAIGTALSRLNVYLERSQDR